MSILLLHLVGNRILNRTIFPPNLYIHDDLLIYKKRTLISSKEITISYNQISQITLQKGVFFATLEMITTGTDDILINFLPKGIAAKAKKIIDQKIYHSHAKHNNHQPNETSTSIAGYEKALNRLKELLQKGQISEKEYNTKKLKYLNEIK